MWCILQDDDRVIWKYSWLVMLWYLVSWQYMIQERVIHTPCWDACWRCSCNGLELCKCMIWHLSRLTQTSLQLTQKGKYRKLNDSNNIVGPGRESQMYSHYDMLCEHSWWYLYLGYFSQPHHGYIHTICYIIILYHRQKMYYTLGIIGVNN